MAGLSKMSLGRTTTKSEPIESQLRRPTLLQILCGEPDVPKDDTRWAVIKCVPPTEQFLIGMCNKVATAVAPRLEQLWELQALYQVASDEKIIDWRAAATIDKAYAEAESHVHARNSNLRYSQEYTYWVTQIYTYVYSSHVETVSEWRTIAKMIDKEKADFLPGEYEKLIELIGQHSVEISNAAYLLEGRRDLLTGNTLRCNYAAIDFLAAEVGNFAQRPLRNRPDWENDFLWCKVTLAEKCNIITWQEGDFLRKSLKPTELDWMAHWY